MNDTKINLRAMREGIDAAAAAWIAGMQEDLAPETMHLLDRCESPIEARLLGALRWSYLGYNPHGVLSVRGREAFDPQEGESEAGIVYLVPQFDLAGYRIDIMVYAGDRLGGWVPLAIECDGHDFHDRTKEQAARDRRRDRALNAVGITTARFTGSEIHNDVMACVMDVASIITAKIDDRLAAARVKINTFMEGSSIPPNLADHYERWNLVFPEDPSNPRDKDYEPGDDQ